jgi:hypothetical protein
VLLSVGERELGRWGVGRGLEAALEVEVEVESGLAVGADVQVQVGPAHTAEVGIGIAVAVNAVDRAKAAEQPCFLGVKRACA